MSRARLPLAHLTSLPLGSHRGADVAGDGGVSVVAAESRGRKKQRQKERNVATETRRGANVTQFSSLTFQTIFAPQNSLQTSLRTAASDRLSLLAAVPRGPSPLLRAARLGSA